MGIEGILADFEKVETACREMEKNKILVGIVGEADSDVLTIAYAHEYGNGKLPERSFIRASFDADQNILNKIISGAINNVLSNKTTPNVAAELIGAQSAQLVQNFIDGNRVKPQSDFTNKTQHTTLYETGTHIRDRIAYKVVNE